MTSLLWRNPVQQNFLLLLKQRFSIKKSPNLFYIKHILIAPLIMSGTSNVGGRGVYEAGDQRTAKNSEEQQADRFHEGKENSHKANDSSTANARPCWRISIGLSRTRSQC
jgi:hypothetical protein